MYNEMENITTVGSTRGFNDCKTDKPDGTSMVCITYSPFHISAKW